MKKKLFLGLLAAAAVSFTACQKDEVLNEVQQDNAIGFGTYVSRDAQTKATEANLTTLKLKGFGVFAYYTGADSYPTTTNTSYAPSFMNNEKVWVQTGTSNFTYENTKYWPGNSDQYKVSFFAYAPYTKIDTSTPTTNITAFGTTGTGVSAGKGDPTLTFKVASTVSQQVDLLYATPVTNRWYGDWEIDNQDALTDQSVNFTFKHALSRIGFKVITNRPDYKVNISKITLTGDFNTTGTLNLNTGEWSVIEEANSDSYELNFNPVATVTNATTTPINATEGYVMTIPTDFPSSSLSVTVNYTYEYEVSTGVWAAPVNDEKSGTVTTNFAQGQAYTLVMTLDPMSAIEFAEPIVNPWVATNSNPTNVTVTPAANNN